jgi:tetratricopeptide (TPR) repeat protein
VAGILVLTAPVTIRNAIVSGDFVLITSNAGLNFYIGNGPESSGAYQKPAGLDVEVDPAGRTLAEADLGRPLSPSEVSAWWMDRSLHWIRNRPVAAAALLVKKVSLFWTRMELPQIEHYGFTRRYVGLLKAPLLGFGLLAPLGLAGLLLERRDPVARPLGLFLAAFCVSIVLFFVLSRYRMPVVPVLAVLSARTIIHTWRAARARDLHRLAVPVGGTAVAALLVHVNFYHVHPESAFDQFYYRLGIVHEERSRALARAGDGEGAARELEEAEASLREAVRRDPAYPRSRLNLGALLAQQGRYDEAEEHLRAALAAQPGYAKGHFNLAVLHLDRGYPEAALEELELAVEADPGYEAAWRTIGLTRYRMGDYEAARTALLRAASLLDPRSRGAGTLRLLANKATERATRVGREGTAGPYLREGDLARAEGRGEAAWAAYRRAVAADPAAPDPRYELALLRLEAGDAAGALAELDTLGWLETDYPRAGLARGVALLEAGRVEEAVAVLRRAVERSPDEPEGHRQLARALRAAGAPEEADRHDARARELSAERGGQR